MLTPERRQDQGIQHSRGTISQRQVQLSSELLRRAAASLLAPREHPVQPFQ